MNAIEQLLLTLGFKQQPFNWEDVAWRNADIGVSIYAEELPRLTTGAHVARLIHRRAHASGRYSVSSAVKQALGITS